MTSPTWPAPLWGTAKVVESPMGGWGYTFGGHFHWTAHLTNALHDAGYEVARNRRKAARS